MRKLLIAGAALIALTAIPGTSSAQGVSDAVPGSADQLNGQSAPAPATTTTVLSADPSMPDTVVTNYPGNMAAVPPAAMNKSYPVCTPKLQDGCQNRGEGGAPGHSRALHYWPGKPASEQ
jgi:hypothetical protein